MIRHATEFGGSFKSSDTFPFKGAVPSLNNLPENSKSVHSLGFTQLVGSTQDAQFVRGRQLESGKVASICGAVHKGVYKQLSSNLSLK